jgi:hypothetical protein
LHFNLLSFRNWGRFKLRGNGFRLSQRNIYFGDFDITQKIYKRPWTCRQSLEVMVSSFIKIRRYIPEFISQTDNSQVTLNLCNYSNDTASSSSLGPFTVTSSTTKVDTRARARAIALKVANTGSGQDWKLGTFRLDIQPDGRR